MKKIKVMGKICGFDGEPIKDPTGEIVKAKDIILQYLATYTGKDAKKIIRARNLGQKIYDAKKDPITIDDADLDLIIESMETPQHTAMALGPVLEDLEEAKLQKEKT